jgi:hypothetical protein
VVGAFDNSTDMVNTLEQVNMRNINPTDKSEVNSSAADGVTTRINIVIHLVIYHFR